MILLIKIVQLLFNLMLLQQDLTLGGIVMKFKKTQDEFDGKLTSLSQKVGVSIIGILTALGTGLIIYTGVMAATYDVAQQENEYLTYEDVEADIITDSNTTDQSAQSTESSDVVVSTDVTDSSNETDKSEDTETESEISTPTDNSVAYCNNDGVNVRDEAATGTEIIGNLNSGDEVKVLNRYYNDEWVQISFEGQTGYVHKDFLTFK